MDAKEIIKAMFPFMEHKLCEYGMYNEWEGEYSKVCTCGLDKVKEEAEKIIKDRIK